MVGICYRCGPKPKEEFLPGSGRKLCRSCRESNSKTCSKCGTEKPLSEFYPGQGWCRGCEGVRRKRYYKRNRRSLIEWQQNFYKENKRSIRNSLLLREYGITLSQYEEMDKRQDGKCAICREPEKRKNFVLAVDHNHETKEVRGLLCSSCNPKLGWFEKRMAAIFAYLKLDAVKL